MIANIATQKVRIVSRNWSNEESEVTARMRFNTFYNRMVVKFEALKLAEGASFPAQLDVYDGEGGMARYSIVQVFTAEPQIATYKSACSDLIVSK